MDSGFGFPFPLAVAILSWKTFSGTKGSASGCAFLGAPVIPPRRPVAAEQPEGIGNSSQGWEGGTGGFWGRGSRGVLGGDLGHERFPTLPPCRHVPGIPQGGWGLRGGHTDPQRGTPWGFEVRGCIDPWLHSDAWQEEMDPDLITLSTAVQRHDGAAEPAACSVPRRTFLGTSLVPAFQGLWSVGFLAFLWDQTPDLIQRWLLASARPLKAPWFVRLLSVTEPAVTLLPSPSSSSPCTQPLPAPPFLLLAPNTSRSVECRPHIGRFRREPQAWLEQNDLGHGSAPSRGLTGPWDPQGGNWSLPPDEGQDMGRICHFIL